MKENDIETLIDAKKSAQRVQRYGRQKEAEFWPATISRPERANVPGRTTKGGEGTVVYWFEGRLYKNVLGGTCGAATAIPRG